MKDWFIYKHRFLIGYILLAIVFIVSVIALANIAPRGLSQTEKDSLIASSAVNLDTLKAGNVINFPYHAIQHLFLHLFGLNFFSIKLPTLLFAIATGIFIILLFNRHFKNTVAILSSILSLFSVAILFVSGNGSPLIMYPFWLSLIIWLGSKLINQKHPNVFLSVIFVASLIFALYTPYMLYAVILIIIAGFLRPHARFVIHKLGTLKLSLCIVAITFFLSPFIYFLCINPATRHGLLAGHFADFNGFLENLRSSFSIIVSFGRHPESIFLAPLFNLVVIILTLIGLFKLIKNFSTAYSIIILVTLIFSIIATGLDPNSISATFIPIILLTGIGISSLIGKWYSYFPFNPYAHIVALVPLGILFAIVIISNFNFFISGYTYAPTTVRQFDNDLYLIQANLQPNDTLLAPADNSDTEFYRFIANRCSYRFATTVPKKLAKNSKLAVVATYPQAFLQNTNFKLAKIITSPRFEDSARLYIYE